MAIGKLIFILILKVNGWNVPSKDINWLNEYEKKYIYIYVYSLQEFHIGIESEGIDKDTPCKWKSKEKWDGNTHMRQNKLKNIDCYKRDGRSTTIHKANANSQERENQ